MGRAGHHTRCWPGSGRSSITTRSTRAGWPRSRPRSGTPAATARSRRCPDAAIHASLKAAGLLGGRASRDLRRPGRLRHAADHRATPTTRSTPPAATSSSSKTTSPSTGCSPALRFARMYNSRSDHAGAFGPGWSSLGRRPPDPARRRRRYVGPDGQRALFPAHGRRLRPRARRQRARRARRVRARAALVRRRAAGTSTRPACPRASRAAPAPTSSSRTRTGGWPSCATPAAAPCACTGTASASRRSRPPTGAPSTYRYEDGDLVEADGRAHYEIGDGGRVLSVTDADGVVEVANAYDEQGRVIRQLSPFGRNTMFGYLPGHVTVTSDDTDGPTNVFIHDTAGRLLSLLAGDETRVAFQYDAHGNPVAVTDRKGAVTVQEWDERANLKRRVLPTGAEFTFTHDDARPRRSTSPPPPARSFRHVYEGDERSPAELIDAEGGVTRLTRRGRPRARDRRPRRRPPALRLRRRRQPVAATDADGNTARLERDAAGIVIAAISPLGRRTTYVPDAHGRPLERHEPGGAVWRYEYSARRPPDRRHRPHGRAPGDPLRRARRGRGHRRPARPRHDATRYDVLGNLTEVVAPGDATWRFAYDELCRLTAHLRPDRRDLAARVRRGRQPDRHRRPRRHPLRGRPSTRPAASRALDDGMTSAASTTTCSAAAWPTRARTAPPRTPPTTGSAGGPRSSTRSAAPPASTTRPPGACTRITDPSGRVTTFEYDRCGRARRARRRRRPALGVPLRRRRRAGRDDRRRAASRSGSPTTTPAGSSSGTRPAAG